MNRQRTRRFVLSMAFVVVLVNLPMLTTVINGLRLAASGEDRTAEVVETARSDDGEAFLVSFRLGEGDDEQVWPVPVDEETWRRAEEQGTVQVRVLPGRESVHRVEGEVRSWSGWVGTVAMDVVVVGVGVLWWRTRKAQEAAEAERAGEGDRGDGEGGTTPS